MIDGDTVEALVDLGSHSFTERRLRLAKINAPEIATKAGREARNFLIEELASAQTIVLQTVKMDFHGRYVAHLLPRRTSSRTFARPRDVASSN